MLQLPKACTETTAYYTRTHVNIDGAFEFCFFVDSMFESCISIVQLSKHVKIKDLLTK